MSIDQEAAAKIERQLDIIHAMFNEGVRVTLIIRNPPYDTSTDVIVTTDNLDEVVDCIKINQEFNPPKPRVIQ